VTKARKGKKNAPAIPSASRRNIPELDWYHGYPFALGLMAAVVGGLLFFFWRRGWLR